MLTFKNILQYTFFFGVLSIALLLPVFPRATGVCLVILIITWLLDGNLRMKFQTIGGQRAALVFISIYFIYLLGIIYTSNVLSGMNNLVLKISMLFFPLIFFATGRLHPPPTKFILQSFVTGSFLTCLMMLIIAVISYFISGKNNFTYSNLSAPLSLQPAAFSMYLLFCIFILFIPVLEGKKNHLPGLRISWFLIVFFSLMIILLSARQEIIAFLLFIPASLLYYFFKRKKRLVGIVVSAGLGVAMLAIVLLVPETKMRLEKMQSQMDESYSNEAPNSVTMRKVIWESAVEIIAEHPLIGVGTGDVNDALKNKYRQKNLIWPLNDDLNAHNQYLQTAIAVGIPGLLIFIFSLLYGCRITYSKRHELYLVFLLLFVFCNITECMLEEEAGVVFFAFFNSLLAVETLRQPNRKL
jgi:O-antigen ligase